MKNSLRIAFLTLFVALIALGCKPKELSQAAPVMTYEFEPGAQDYLTMAALWQQHSGEYRALCYQSYNFARIKLDEILANSRFSKKPCVIFDIDETVLDNSPYTGWQIISGQPYSDSTWMRWTNKAMADTVPGSLGFARYAKSRGVEVFYISNRMVAETGPTMKNLSKFGYPDVDERHMLLKTETSNKEARRQKVLETNAIAMLVGDNLNDFSEIFEKQSTAERNRLVDNQKMGWGSHFVIIPNAMYGSWYGALLDYKRGMSPTEEDSLRKANLKNFER